MSVSFSRKTKRRFNQLLSHYPDRKAALLPTLYLAQEEFGQVSPEMEKYVASLLEVPVVAIREVMSFYTRFHDHPIGKYHIQVCESLSCNLLGAESLIDYLSGKLNIRVGETTPDRKFTLSTVECLGACELAPMMQINQDYYESLTEEKIDHILTGLE